MENFGDFWKISRKFKKIRKFWKFPEIPGFFDENDPLVVQCNSETRIVEVRKFEDQKKDRRGSRGDPPGKKCTSGASGHKSDLRSYSLFFRKRLTTPWSYGILSRKHPIKCKFNEKKVARRSQKWHSETPFYPPSSSVNLPSVSSSSGNLKTKFLTNFREFWQISGNFRNCQNGQLGDKIKVLVRESAVFFSFFRLFFILWKGKSSKLEYKCAKWSFFWTMCDLLAGRGHPPKWPSGASPWNPPKIAFLRTKPSKWPKNEKKKWYYIDILMYVNFSEKINFFHFQK